MAISREKVSKNIIWRMAESASTQIISYVVALVLARKLGPDVYGNFALAGGIISFLLTFVDIGFSTVLIQKRDAEDIDYSSVFVYNVVAGVVLYLIAFLTAPLVASYYGKPILCNVIRVFGLKLVITAFSSIQNVYITKHIAFKLFFWASLTGTLLSGTAGLLLVYYGYGIWSLVALSIVDLFIDTVFLWFMTKWNPVKGFSMHSLKKLFKTGKYYLVGTCVSNASVLLNSVIISKKYTSADLGYYNKGSILPERIFATINSTIESVLFPVMSESSDDLARVKALERRTIKTTSFIIFPALYGLAAVSPALIRFVLTDAWISAVPFSMIFCFSASLRIFQSANLNTLKSLGQSKILFYLEFVSRSLQLVSLLITLWFGPVAIAIGSLIAAVIFQVIIAFPVKRLINYSIKEQIRDVFPYFLTSIIMFVAVYFIGFINLTSWVVLIIQVLCGIVLYFAVARIFRFESFDYSVDTVKKLVSERKK